MEAKVDLLVPMLGTDVQPWVEAVDAAISHNQIPVHLWIYNDGGGGEGNAAIKTLAGLVDRRRVPKIRAMGSSGRIYFAKAINRLLKEALETSRCEFVAVLHPSVLVESEHWIDTLLQPFSKDKAAATISSFMKGLYSSVPWKVRGESKPYRLRLQAFRKDVFRRIGLLHDSAPDDLHAEMLAWEKSVMLKHWTCWRDNRVRAIERSMKDPDLTAHAYEEVARRSRGEALTFVDA